MPLGGNCGTNPNGPMCLTPAQHRLLDAWAAGGFLETAPPPE
jgi:hypothetical protein